MILATNVTRDIPEAHLAVLSEIAARGSGIGVERDQPGIERGFEDTAPAWPVGFRSVAPERHAAINEPVAVIPGQFGLWVERPALPS